MECLKSVLHAVIIFLFSNVRILMISFRQQTMYLVSRRFPACFPSHLRNLILFFCEYCWFWLANVSAFSDVYWMSFRLSIMLLNSNAWLLNCSRRVSKSWMKTSEISLIWLSYSFVLVSIFLRILLKPLCWSQV